MGSRASRTMIITSLLFMTSFSWRKNVRRVCWAARSSLRVCDCYFMKRMKPKPQNFGPPTCDSSQTAQPSSVPGEPYFQSTHQLTANSKYRYFAFVFILLHFILSLIYRLLCFLLQQLALPIITHIVALTLCSSFCFSLPKCGRPISFVGLRIFPSRIAFNLFCLPFRIANLFCH